MVFSCYQLNLQKYRKINIRRLKKAHLGRAVAGEDPLSGLLDTLHVLLHRGQDLAAQVPAPARVVLSPASSSELGGSKWIAAVHFTILYSLCYFAEIQIILVNYILSLEITSLEYISYIIQRFYLNDMS